MINETQVNKSEKNSLNNVEILQQSTVYVHQENLKETNNSFNNVEVLQQSTVFNININNEYNNVEQL